MRLNLFSIRNPAEATYKYGNQRQRSQELEAV
jgi:hypothetical protein